MSAASRLIHAVIFASAVFAWIIVKNLNLTESFLTQVYLCTLGATVVVYIASVIFKNVSLYDTYWGLQGTLYAVTYYLTTKQELNTRSLIATVLSCVWSLRLTFLFVLYSWTDIYAEDWRYRLMRNKTNNYFLFSIRSYFMHYMLPMTIGFFGHVPLFYITRTTQNEWGLIDSLGVGITLFGVVFEAIADYQLRSSVFKSKHNTSMNSSGTDPSLCMSSGLWSLCRHPNYFGEFLYWLGLYVIGLGTGGSLFDKFYIASLVVGTVMLYLVLNYISIPFMEKRQLKRREKAYQIYMKKVPYSFFPLNLF